jgi:hypothetical protein
VKWGFSNKKAMLVPLLVPLFVVEYLSQTIFRLKMSFVGW